MNVSLLDQEQETELLEIKFPRYEPFEMAVYECRIYNKWGRLIQVIPAKRIDEVLNEIYTEPTYRERLEDIIPSR